MKNKKGFTLIELIAIIVILGVIALITTSQILRLVERNRQNAFELSLENLIKSFELLNSEGSLETDHYENVSVTSPLLGKSNENFVSGELGYNSDRDVEVRYVSNNEYCGAGTSGKFQIKKGDCTGLDISAPIIQTISVIPSQYSIRFVIAAEDRETGIAKYEISQDGVNYVEIGSDYTLNNLKAATEYEVYIRVTNGKNLYTVEKKTVSTLALELPLITITPSGWAKEKNVQIIYPEGEFTYSYNLNGTGWQTVEDNEVNITLYQNGYIVARVSDATTFSQSLTTNITMIDIDDPICDIMITDENRWATSKQITINGYDYYSGVAGIQKPGETEFTNNSSVSYTTTSQGMLQATVKDNVGRTGTCEVEVSRIDPTAPQNVVIAISDRTTKSITAEASAVDNESGIVKYEFSFDGGAYINNGNNRVYKFEELVKGAHTIKVRVTNGAGLVTESAVKNTETIEPTYPTYSGNTGSWAKKKTITITYPTREEDFVYEYSINGGSWTPLATGVLKTIDFTAAGYVVARIYDGVNYFTSATYNVTMIDSVAPTISHVFAGGMLYGDPTFSSSENSTYVYNNLGNGTVTKTRVSMSTPVGSYALKIQTTGSASPGWGGFYFATGTWASRTLVTRIVAKIPVGYTINWHTNAVGDNATTEWLSSQAGTGDWEEYMFRITTGSSGSFSSTNFFALTGGSTPTSSNPLVWYVAYATVISPDTWGKPNYISFKGHDSVSAIKAYGINQSSTTEPSWTTLSTGKNPYTNFVSSNSNASYYVWVKDEAGNTAKQQVTVNRVDGAVPTCSISQSSASSWTTSKTLTITGSDDQGVSGIMKPGASSYTSGSSTTLSVTANGTYTATVKDVAGRTNTCSITVSYIDRTAPSCSMSSDTSNWATSKWVTVNKSDSQSSTTVLLPGASSYTDSTGFTAYNTTTYTVYVKDAAGNTNSCSHSTALIGDIVYGEKQAYNLSGGYMKLGTDSVFNLNQNTFHFYARVAKDCAGDRLVAQFGSDSVGWRLMWMTDGRMQWRTCYSSSCYYTYSSNYLPATYTFYDLYVDFNSTGTGKGTMTWGGTATTANRSGRHQYSSLQLTLGTWGIMWRNYVRCQGRDYPGNQPDRYGYINNLGVGTYNQSTGSLSIVNTQVTQDSWWQAK